jgi:hypothetical protein
MIGALAWESGSITDSEKFIAYIKISIITGILVIIPIAVIGVILTGVIKKLIAATVPLTNNMFGKIRTILESSI